jgi:pilus assembly protein CpaE
VPFSSEQLTSTIREVYRRLQNTRVVVRAPAPATPAPAAPSVNGKTIAVFGPKGGVGKTMVAANLAVAIRQLRGKATALADGNFAMGDLHLYLNIKPDHTILDFVERGQEGDLETLQRILQRHASGLAFLARPERPEHAEMVSAEAFRRVLDLLNQAYEYTVVDCATTYDDRTLAVLDRADTILLLVTPEVGALINATIFLDLAQVLGYPRERVRIVLNRYDSQVGISVGDAESAFSRPVEFRIPSRGRDLASTLNAGVPIITAQPGSEVAKVIGQIAEVVTR